MEADRDLRGLAALFGSDQIGVVDRYESRFDGLAALIALLDRGFEPVIDLAAQQILQLPAVARSKSRHDHVVGGTRAGHEMLGIEALVLPDDGIESGCK